MATARKRQDEKHLKILRELASLPANKQCFDCHQRGPTYVNMTIGSFVCTSCSGILRGLTSPHRVKSISMASFTAEEIETIRARGNEYCQRVWLGNYDGKSSLESETKDEQHIRDFMVAKYEKKRYYLDPMVAMKNISSSQPQASTPVQSQSSQASSTASTPDTKPLGTLMAPPGSRGVSHHPQHSVQPSGVKTMDLLADLGNGDPFGSSGMPSGNSGQASFANFDNNPVFSSSEASSPKPQTSSLPRPHRHMNLNPPWKSPQGVRYGYLNWVSFPASSLLPPPNNPKGSSESPPLQIPLQSSATNPAASAEERQYEPQLKPQTQAINPFLGLSADMLFNPSESNQHDGGGCSNCNPFSGMSNSATAAVAASATTPPHLNSQSGVNSSFSSPLSTRSLQSPPLGTTALTSPPTEDRYAALKDLDSLFKNQGNDSHAWQSPVSSSNISSSSNSSSLWGSSASPNPIAVSSSSTSAGWGSVPSSGNSNNSSVAFPTMFGSSPQSSSSHVPVWGGQQQSQQQGGFFGGGPPKPAFSAANPFTGAAVNSWSGVGGGGGGGGGGCTHATPRMVSAAFMPANPFGTGVAIPGGFVPGSVDHFGTSFDHQGGGRVPNGQIPNGGVAVYPPGVATSAAASSASGWPSATGLSSSSGLFPASQSMNFPPTKGWPTSTPAVRNPFLSGASMTPGSHSSNPFL